MWFSDSTGCVALTPIPVDALQRANVRIRVRRRNRGTRRGVQESAP
jgi:hypothetical protein